MRNLSTSGSIYRTTPANFTSNPIDMEGGNTTLSTIYFYGGANCSKCRQLFPFIDKLVYETYKSRNINLQYIDCESNLHTIPNDVTSIPTVIYTNSDGEELQRFVDIHPISEYNNKILYYT